MAERTIRLTASVNKLLELADAIHKIEQDTATISFVNAKNIHIVKSNFDNDIFFIDVTENTDDDN